MTKRSYRWLFVLLAVVGLTADQLSKYHMFRWLYHDGQPVNDGTFAAWHTVNPWVVRGGDAHPAGGRCRRSGGGRHYAGDRRDRPGLIERYVGRAERHRCRAGPRRQAPFA